MENNIDNVLSEQFHDLQREVLEYYFKEYPKTLVLYGSVRSGKTYVLVALFLMLVAINANKKKVYLISGRNQASIWRNVIMDMERILGRSIQLDRANCFDLFGNKVLVLEGGMKGTNLKLRGNTLSGCLINETTTIFDEFIQEAQNRLSDNTTYNGWMLCDTNPDSLQSYIYRNYVTQSDKKLKSGRTSVKAFKFTIWDNPYITEEYVEDLIAKTPNGHMFERMINGEWCNSAGIIFQDYNAQTQIIDSISDEGHYEDYEDFLDDVDYFIGSIDFGYEHWGVALLGAKTYSGRYYILECCMDRQKQFDHYGAKLLQWKEKYGRKFVTYFDWARPDGGAFLEDMGLEMEKANKQVLEGITNTCSIMKQGKLFFLADAFPSMAREQIEMYEWRQNKDGDTKDEPKKENDDFCDALRYLIHSDMMANIETNEITVPGMFNFMG